MIKKIIAVISVIAITVSFSGCAALQSFITKFTGKPEHTTDPANPSVTDVANEVTDTTEFVVPDLVPTGHHMTTTEAPETTTEKQIEPTTEEPVSEVPTTEEPTTEEPTTIPPYSGPESVHEMALEVIRGRWKNGSERKRLLEEAGYNYAEVQAEVNRILGYTEQEINID